MTSTELDQVISRIDRLEKSNKKAMTSYEKANAKEHKELISLVKPVVEAHNFKQELDQRASKWLKRFALIVPIASIVLFWIYQAWDLLMDSAVSPMLQKFSGR
ncbi:MAG TPA: hypothetical protein ENH82_03960 [bacterium]|nr:hypothetical protein [bacterium]